MGTKDKNTTIPIIAVQPKYMQLNIVATRIMTGAPITILMYIIMSASRCPSLAKRLTS